VRHVEDLFVECVDGGPQKILVELIAISGQLSFGSGVFA
jgi:hypothetical protein